MQKLLENLNSDSTSERLTALAELVQKVDKPVPRDNDANNHIHTIYSFSPYSPTKATYMAYVAGLTSAGIMDHDSLSGAKEFKRACEILNIGSTSGVEVRVKFDRGFGRINHPDQENCLYMAAHGVAERYVDDFNAYLQKYRDERNERNRKMCQLITEKFGQFGIALDFDLDVYPLSSASEGGSITERHLLYALAKMLAERFGQTPQLIQFLRSDLQLEVSPKIEGYLLDKENPHFLYDLLGVLKADTKFFYIDADEEMPDAEEFVKVAESFGAIPAYAYLGDVGNSVTGDKKTQKFEDDYLEDLMISLKRVGYKAIAYMPTRNTRAQLKRVQSLYRKYGFFEICGEDVNSPRQKFTCDALADPAYSHLIESTWALIGHEYMVNEMGVEAGMFSATTISEMPNLQDRIKKYASIGRNTIK